MSNLIELEAPILLEHAKLEIERSESEPSTTKSKQLALEALRVADRCEYRLQQAEIHNFLAVLFLRIDDLPKARHHCESAKERASCGVDPSTSPYYYKPAYEEANRICSVLQTRE